MTETVIVTPAPPIVNVQVPPDTLDVWKDIIWGDFGGAALAVLGGLVAGWLASRIVVRGERRTREEENRRTIAMEYADAARQLAGLLRVGFKQEPVENAIERFDLLGGRIYRFYSPHPVHGPYARWATNLAGPIGTRASLALWGTQTPFGPNIDHVELNELRTDLQVIEHSTLEWIRSPERWKPDESAREAHRRAKELLAPTEGAHSE